MKFGYVFTKKLRTTLEKFLGKRSNRFTNTTQRFLDKRDFLKLEKNLKNSYVSGQIDKSLVNNFFFTSFLIIFWNY